MLWIDGQISEGANASFNLTDRGLLLGDGLFETLPCFNGIPFLADAHLKRMTLAGDQIGLAVGLDVEADFFGNPIRGAADIGAVEFTK